MGRSAGREDREGRQPFEDQPFLDQTPQHAVEIQACYTARLGDRAGGRSPGDCPWRTARLEDLEPLLDLSSLVGHGSHEDRLAGRLADLVHLWGLLSHEVLLDLVLCEMAGQMATTAEMSRERAETCQEARAENPTGIVAEVLGLAWVPATMFPAGALSHSLADPEVQATGFPVPEERIL